MRLKKSSILVCAGILALVLLAGACHKKEVVAPAPPAPPTPTPPAPTVTLTAEPSTVERGQSVTLSWSSQNATNVDLEPAVGKVQAQGSSSVTPSDSTTYTITATGPGGTQSQTARVTVTVPPPAPPPPAPVKEVSEQDLFGQNVKDAFFDYDKSDLRPDAEQALSADANFLKEHPGAKFTIEGHCDDRGSEEYNLGLGDRRATEAKTYLINAGVSGAQISTISYGKDRPFCQDHTEECWQQNRRDHFHYGPESR
jgi:peptidoglycan-associated lipoprotein